jgi:hypothetical protein
MLLVRIGEQRGMGLRLYNRLQAAVSLLISPRCSTVLGAFVSPQNAFVSLLLLMLL